MRGQPLLEQWRDGVGQPQRDLPANLAPACDRCGDDGGDLVIGQPRNHWRNHHADGNAGAGQRANSRQPRGGRRGARLHDFAQIRVEGGHGNEHCDGVVPRQFGKQIEVARDELVLGDDADRVAEFGEHFQAAAA